MRSPERSTASRLRARGLELKAARASTTTAGLDSLRAKPLTGRFIRLEPLRPAHAEELFELARDETIWQFMPDQPITSLALARDRIDSELNRAIPFAIRMLSCDSFAGCIEYGSVDVRNESVEIGWTWTGHPFRGTLAAPEALHLLLANAFDAHGAGRVWMATDARNKASNTGLRTFGVHFEACLRRHLRLKNGFIRDTNIYSITIDEWPARKQKWSQLIEACASSGDERPSRRGLIAQLFRDG
jgi:N-acetyltransferase